MPPRRNPEARRAPLAAGLALAALAALLWAGRAELPEHLARWFAGGRAGIAVDYARLSAELDAAALARLVGGVALPCRDAAAGSVCEAALSEANGLPAAHLRATWQQARLRTVEVDVPWWAHHDAVRMLTARLGPPVRADAALPGSGQAPGILWALPHGALRIDRAPGWNPWAWSTLRWAASAARPG